MSTEEMTSQMLDMLKGISKRLDLQDEQMKDMHELIMKKKKTRTRKNPLLPFKNTLSNVEDICTLEIKSTDNKIFLGLICCQKDEEKATKAPVFSLTSNIFSDFMEQYLEAEDGEKVPLPEEAVFTRKFAESLLDTWQMPDKLRK